MLEAVTLPRRITEPWLKSIEIGAETRLCGLRREEICKGFDHRRDAVEWILESNIEPEAELARHKVIRDDAARDALMHKQKC